MFGKRRRHGGFLGGGKRKYRRKGLFAIKLKKQTVYTVAAIWLWLFAATITLSFFGEGKLLTKLREELDSHMGWVMYGLPPFLVTLSFLFFKIKSDLGKPNIPLGIGMLLGSLMGLTQAGVFGEFLWNTVAAAISAEGGVLLFLGLLVMSLIILFNTSLDRFINFLLTGIGTIADSLRRARFAFPQKKEKQLLPQTALPLKIKGLDDKLAKAPMTPPPIPAKAALKITMPATQPGDYGVWEYPPLSLLSEGPAEKADRGDMRKNAETIEKTLDSFGIRAHVVEVNPGPAVTQYAFNIALGTKLSKITSLASDLALALAAPTGQVRIEAPIPGRDLVGVEIPNRGLEFVTLKRMLSSTTMQKSKSKLAVSLGLDVSGNPLMADLTKMPHVLVAGTTGSGKSVLLNAWICSLLFRTTPADVRMILIDPKRVEMTQYNGIPHLLVPVIVEQDKILSALRWAIGEMQNRYKQFAEAGVRNIEGYNEMSGFQALPYIVILVDELADLMLYAPAEVEDSVVRLAQMARATGIHLVISTQRPSVNVITGIIKANIPARIAFNVSSMIDSRVIIDMPGAEKLLGRGDMLYVPPDQSKATRIQGTFVSEREVSKVVEFLRSKNAPASYTEEVTSLAVPISGKKGMGGVTGDGRDEKFEEALRLICQYDKASASLLQRRMQVGYARAARILDQLEEVGAIGPGEGAKPRDVLAKNPDEFLAQLAQQQSQ
ncbi:DNA translocase FtsK [Candidatus Gottesmanbacteria bacterium]|nr:DNA translocase FtsK [Candidatus Gottesmanbacteria bacterium]